MILMKSIIVAAFVSVLKATVQRQTSSKTLTIEKLIQMGAGN
jgi:hypothetical protein